MDFEPGSIRQVAQALLGEPNAQLSKPDELRYGSHGSLSIDLEKNTFFDHEKSEGGGLLDLVQRETKARSKKAAMQWLQERGFLNLPPTEIQANQTTKYDYFDESGALLLQVLRFHPKRFMQRCPTKSGGWKYKVAGLRQVPYRLPELLAAPANQTIYVVEGERDADRLASLGLVATTNAGGAGKWRAEHSKHLEGRTVFIVPDNDNAGRNHAQKVAKSLQGIAAHVRILELPDLPEKGDVSDWLDAGGTAEKLVALPTRAIEPNEKGDVGDDEERKRSQTDLLVEFALQHFELLHDKNGDCYAQDKTTGEVRRLGGRQFKDKLIAGFYEKTEVAVRDQSLREALGTLNALARHKGELKDVHIRVAQAGGRYYIDMAEPGNSRAIELSAGSWKVVDTPPVLFVRGEAMQPLPPPIQGGNVGPLWSIANVPTKLRPLVLAWLVDAIRPETPYPGMELTGEQGSGKSTTAEALRRVIDPNACNLRGSPKTVEDIFVAAGQNHLVVYENVSHLPGPMQDALAILSTGGGYSKRALYTNEDEHVINVRRPWLVNGISIAVTQQDLVDRVISIDCPVIEVRQPSSQQWHDFGNELPNILGGLLDLAAKSLALLPRMKLPTQDRPRLVEFVLLGMAVSEAMGNKAQDFVICFKELRAETVARTLDASPVAAAVLELMDDQNGIDTTVKDLLARLERYKPLGADAWPRSPKGLGDALRRAAPALRQMDIDCKCLGKVGGTVKWSIKRQSRSSSPTNPEVLVMDGLMGEFEQDIRTSRTSQPRLSSGVEVQL